MNEEQREWFSNWRMVIRDYTFDSDKEYVSDGELIDLLLWKLDEWGIDPPPYLDFDMPEDVTEKTRRWVRNNLWEMEEQNGMNGHKNKRQAGIWECRCNWWNSFFTARLNDDTSTRISLDCKKCGKRKSVWYRSLKWNNSHWLVNHKFYDFRSEAEDEAHRRNHHDKFSTEEKE